MTARVFDNHNEVREGDGNHLLNASSAEASSRLIEQSHQLSDNIVLASRRRKAAPEEPPNLIDLTNDSVLIPHLPEYNGRHDPREHERPQDPDSYD